MIRLYQVQQLVNWEKPSTNLILGSLVDLALVCNPKGQRSHEFSADHTLWNLLNLIIFYLWDR